MDIRLDPAVLAGLTERQGYRALDWLVRTGAPAFLRAAHLTREALLLSYRPEIRSLRAARAASGDLVQAMEAGDDAWDALLRAGAAHGSADFDAADAAFDAAGVTTVCAVVRAAAGDLAWIAAGDAAWAAAHNAARIVAVRAARRQRELRKRHGLTGSAEEAMRAALELVTDDLSEQAERLLRKIVPAAR